MQVVVGPLSIPLGSSLTCSVMEGLDGCRIGKPYETCRVPAPGNTGLLRALTVIEYSGHERCVPQDQAIAQLT